MNVQGRRKKQPSDCAYPCPVAHCNVIALPASFFVSSHNQDQSTQTQPQGDAGFYRRDYRPNYRWQDRWADGWMDRPERWKDVWPDRWSKSKTGREQPDWWWTDRRTDEPMINRRTDRPPTTPTRFSQDRFQFIRDVLDELPFNSNRRYRDWQPQRQQHQGQRSSSPTQQPPQRKQGKGGEQQQPHENTDVGLLQQFLEWRYSG